MQQYKNRPPHLFLNNQYYFITAKTKNKIPFLNTDKKKKIFLKVLQIGIKKFNIKIFAWAILGNHYHLLVELDDGKKLPFFVKNIHNNSARLINKLDNKIGRSIWFNYWDYCLRHESDFWKHFNYIHNNPVKHGYVKNLDLLSFYKFSSYNRWIKKHGKEWMVSCFAQYPIIDFSRDGD